MREIKFRGYNGIKWLYSESIRYNNTDIQWMIMNEENSEWDYVSFINQYTGLKDKNGVEIYEGDIVQFIDIRAKIVKGFCGYEFEWITRYMAEVRRNNREPIFSNITDVWKVVGNIYENPELLEVNQ